MIIILTVEDEPKYLNERTLTQNILPLCTVYLLNPDYVKHSTLVEQGGGPNFFLCIYYLCLFLEWGNCLCIFIVLNVLPRQYLNRFLILMQIFNRLVTLLSGDHVVGRGVPCSALGSVRSLHQVLHRSLHKGKFFFVIPKAVLCCPSILGKIQQ